MEDKEKENDNIMKLVYDISNLISVRLDMLCLYRAEVIEV